MHAVTGTLVQMSIAKLPTFHFRKLQMNVQTFCDETWPALYTFENSPASQRSQLFVLFIGETLIPMPK